MLITIQKHNWALKDQISTIVERTQHTVVIETLNHDDAWIGEVVSKGLRKKSKYQMF